MQWKQEGQEQQEQQRFFLALHIFITDNCYHIFKTNETKLMAFGLESNKRFKRENYPGKSQPKWQISPVLAIEDQDQIQKIFDPWRPPLVSILLGTLNLQRP